MRGGVHCEQASGVTARVQLVQDRPAHRAGLASRADDGDRLRPQQRLHAGDIGAAAAFLDGRQVGVARVKVDGAAHLRPFELTGRTQAEVGKESQHLVVLAQGIGDERGDTLSAGGGYEVLDEKGADASVVQSVSDGDGDLGGVPDALGVVFGEADQPALRLGQ